MGSKQKSHFSFIGGNIAIDFVNTLVMRAGVSTDLLPDRDALASWLVASRLIDPRERKLVTAGTLRAARRLRAALRSIVAAIAAGATPKRADVRTIDGELRRCAGTLSLDGHFAFDFQPAARDPRFVIARAVASFLSELDPARLRACGGADCILFFYDTSKSGTRRWCTMAGCGNRAKAAGHYRRVRKGW